MASSCVLDGKKRGLVPADAPDRIWKARGFDRLCSAQPSGLWPSGEFPLPPSPRAIHMAWNFLLRRCSAPTRILGALKGLQL